MRILRCVRVPVALVLALVIVLVGAGPAGAHAVLVGSDPQADAVLEQPGVGSATVRVQTPPPPSATVTVQASQPQVASGVTVVEASCVQGAQEVCNGLDDNCNGEIDEGCGYSSGNIQITLAWNTGADLDLYVTDPQGQTLSYSATTNSSGGHLDHDARGMCNQGQANNTIENVYWNQPNPPPGIYAVRVHYWAGASCSTSAGTTNLTLSIAVGGRVIGAYTYAINPDQRIEIAQFQI